MFEDVIFTGRIQRDQLGAAYGSADIFLFPSTTDTQGLVVNEAAGAGLPLILCDPDVSEVFIDGVTGFLSSANDPTKFAVAMETLASNAKMRANLGKAAQQRAAEFSEIGQMRKLEQLYKKSINEHTKVSFAGGQW